MHPRAAFLIETLGLAAHPEGGFFREVYRSPSSVLLPSSSRRSAVTSMYYLLPAGQWSRLHRVASDEVWHFLEGDPLTLHVIEPLLAATRTHLLGPAADNARPVRIVPAHHWQAAVTTGAYTLASCTVGPGFEYEDFSMVRDLPEVCERIRLAFPDLAALL